MSSIRSRRSALRRRSAPRWTPAEWADASIALLARCKGRCEICNVDLRGRAERSHRIRSRDGGDRLSNLLLTHPECHADAHSHDIQAKRYGWRLVVGSDPLAEPVWYQRKGWVLLDDDGGMTPIKRLPPM